MLHQRQDEPPVSDASTAAQTRPGVLTPTPDSSANVLSDGTSSISGARKRKRESNGSSNGSTMEDLLKDSFVVKPYPSTVFVKPRTLHPLILLPRSRLPLAFLDFATSTNYLPQSRLFETHVKILELEERMGSQPMVLIARLDDGRTLYAVEREDRGLYVLCRLGTWVNSQQLREAAVVSKQEAPKESGRCSGSVSFQKEAATVPLVTPETNKYNKKKRLAIEELQSMVKRPSLDNIAKSQPGIELPPSQEYLQLEAPLAAPPAAGDAPSQPTAAEIFENIRAQYSDALYLSKASLAYFTKGPLSRARAAFHLDYDSTLDMNDLVSFLESLILSTTLLDKKYREGVPECVSMIDIHDHSADEANDLSKPKKRKSNKKMKPGKNGLYPSESMFIRRWWSSHDDDAESGGPGSSKDELMKNRIAQLRTRETQLQMVLILEVLALQPLASRPEDVEEGLPLAIPESKTAQGKEKQAKSKKPSQLTMLIDVHIDRLCIWQSIQLEAVKPSLGDSRSFTQELGSSAHEPKHTDNILRDFCVEVIGPFFSARLPDRCAAIHRKLGGPVAASPPRPRLSKSASFSGAPSRPGAATKRPVPTKPRRSLQRVLTDDRERRSISRGPERAISLMRSATMPSVPGLKREGSEAPSLSGIPLATSQQLEANRPGILKSKHLARREVDLSSLAPDLNAKARKQARIEAELKDAISALKKPNRELAGKTLAENVERRSATASHSRKSKKPIRNPLFQGVQISATPKVNRVKDMLSKSQGDPFSQRPDELELDAIPASSIPKIPQSVSRDDLPRNALFHSVQATPTRNSSSRAGHFLDINSAEQISFPPSSPLHVRRSSGQLFAAIPDSVVKSPTTTTQAFFSHEVQETPVKKRPSSKGDHGHFQPAFDCDKENVRKIESAAQKTGLGQTNDTRQEESIYKSLGWDDPDDIDDLA
ncbi:Uncharacterized protein BP5553_01903 [Venustampulla echinocandica]|uniref:DNA replication regulator Sld3 C-terminal domain-containing protein n=1 Tax=Venustampulla echinocandica TaxID=2656787 RepID=A0A370U2B8_9HELO|nr:Uncharacterized protein BP5553_01903 [Venustampulla echinocandica]RDL41924.1 Uncharacterized protein BP5553_01903 [Venustampulla echinocandica]